MPLVLHNFFNYLHNEEIRKRKKREKENIMRDINVREKALSRMVRLCFQESICID